MKKLLFMIQSNADFGCFTLMACYLVQCQAIAEFDAQE